MLMGSSFCLPRENWSDTISHINCRPFGYQCTNSKSCREATPAFTDCETSASSLSRVGGTLSILLVVRGECVRVDFDEITLFFFLWGIHLFSKSLHLLMHVTEERNDTYHEACPATPLGAFFIQRYWYI